MAKEKHKKLGLSILFDIIGVVTSSYVIPIIGDVGDVIWAPLAAILMTRMYKGNVGKAAGVFTFIEEAIPGLDVIPTFTIMWVYTYVFKKQSIKDIIEVDAS
ncbi:hypothetical protein [Aquimarina sp. 2201CG14-23]|uniref:hypothetical protein n=1 Tax=Aquimarina mycalae TaxID=3040073 RepID=UPI0024780BAE|nr:hypothetical protein [Aquimarina sp. 2201CG14-23]MDH7445814.1 hypothetical protein [Aquimarina sp. 2201CG14-23]